MPRHKQRSEPADPPRTSPWRKIPPFRLGGVCIFIILLLGCIPTADISRQQIPGTAIKKAIGSDAICSDIRLLDTRYLAYTQLELVACLDSAGWIAGLEYKPEFHDCEEFALETMAWVRSQLQGIPFGFGLRETQTTHAENLFVDASLNVWIVDLRRHGSELIAASHAFYFLVMI